MSSVAVEKGYYNGFTGYVCFANNECMVENATFYLDSMMIWNDGIFVDGTFSYGLWYKGIWRNGVFGNGLWMDGIWKNGTWCNGTWEDGVWENGEWRDGVWKRGLDKEDHYHFNAPSLWGTSCFIDYISYPKG